MRTASGLRQLIYNRLFDPTIASTQSPSIEMREATWLNHRCGRLNPSGFVFFHNSGSHI